METITATAGEMDPEKKLLFELMLSNNGVWITAKPRRLGPVKKLESTATERSCEAMPSTAGRELEKKFLEIERYANPVKFENNGDMVPWRKFSKRMKYRKHARLKSAVGISPVK
jgi:hypothetical protein